MIGLGNPVGGVKLTVESEDEHKATASDEWRDFENAQAGPSIARSPMSAPEVADRPISFVSSDSTITPSHARRLSKHNRRTSVATKRESMEIMGGLGIVPSASTDSFRSSRRFSARKQSIPSASILFGVDPSREGDRKDAKDWDWRTMYANVEEKEDGEDRLTALEKLEGRSRSASPNSAAQADGAPRSPGRRRESGSGHVSRSSVQLPDFNDVHGETGMDKRVSLVLLESNEQTTSQQSPPNRDSFKSTLAPPPAASSSSNMPTSPSSPSGGSSPRPQSIYINTDMSQPEGLGTLMEEEEEEESTSPQRERPSLDLAANLDDEEARRLRRQVETETIKRNRRGSLTPKPLKLKSRPASLFLTPSMRSGMTASSSMPMISPAFGETPPSPGSEGANTPRSSSMTELASVGEDVEPALVPNPRTWSFAQAQNKLVDGTESSGSKVTPVESTSGPSPPVGQSPARPGLRSLRLGSQTSIPTSEISPASTASASGSPSVASARRNSIMGTINTSATYDMSASSNGGPSPIMLKRSSISYKPSTTSPLAGPGESFTQGSPKHMSTSSGVSAAVFEELKAKSARDASLLDSLRKQVERLQRELAVEGERSAREYAELERWSAEEKRTLGIRLEELDHAGSESAATIAELTKELNETKEQLEDLEAERDMLQDDVDGWRTRCQDLEKTIKTERTRFDEERRLKTAARQRIRQLTEKLEEAGQTVPSDDLNLDDAPFDLASVLRSPSSPSPGYFSPSIGGPEPHTAKVLAEMRQQIFNLVGSLEHERSTYLTARNEVTRLLEENAKLRAEQASTSADESQESTVSSERRAYTSGNKRHVFAYDSSMGSFGMSSTMGSTSLSMTTEENAGTDADDDCSSCRTSPPSTARPSLSFGVNNSILTKPQEGEGVVGLGMGGLQTLTEEEEASDAEASEGDVADVSGQTEEEAELSEEDHLEHIEAQAMEDDYDDHEDGFGAHPSEDMPPTPGLDHDQPPRSPIPVVAVEGETVVDPKVRSGDSRSSDSSFESQGPPSPQVAAAEGKVDVVQRPEFIREWSFPRGATSTPRKDSIEPVEDFFGILSDTILPSLPTREDSLEMPPVYIDQSAYESYDRSPRVSMRIASVGSQQSVGSARRPPVARSAYTQGSFSSSAGHAAPMQTAKGNAANATAASRALSRMSLQGLMSGFSGLSGYLTNQSGVAVTAAAAATKMCTASDNDSAAGSISWAAQRREDGSVDYSNGPISPGGWEAVSHPSSALQARKLTAPPAKQPNRFISKTDLPPPVATPVGQLDFTRCALGLGPVIHL